MQDDASNPDLDAPAPDWFRRAVSRPVASCRVVVDDCEIHYLRWEGESAAANKQGLLFVHGGGAHANWWRFLAPFFTRDFRVAAIDLSGMGDSGRRPEYGSDLYARELLAAIEDARLGERPFVVGHSYGGFQTMRLGAEHGARLGGAVIVDAPIRSPEEQKRRRLPQPPQPSGRAYPDFDTARSRFRLMPAQPCENEFIVEFIARHSVREDADGWRWKFDPGAMSSRRFGEPFHEHLEAVTCRSALVFGEQSALVSRDTAAFMSSLMGPDAPVVEIPEARHHVMLDQPLAFVATIRTLLDGWRRREA